MSGVINVWDEASRSYKPIPAVEGRGIKSFRFDEELNKWVVTYTDGYSETSFWPGPTAETWTFTLSDGTTVQKEVCIG